MGCVHFIPSFIGMKNSSKIYSFLSYAYDISTNFWYMFLHLFSVIPDSKTSFSILITVFALILFNLLARKPNLEKKYYIYSNKFIHNVHLYESSITCPRLQASITCPGLQASGLVRRLLFCS